MNTFKSFTSFAGILNSLAVISIIMYQNDTPKDLLLSKNSSISGGNPLRYFTGLLLFLQLGFLLIKLKLNEF